MTGEAPPRSEHPRPDLPRAEWLSLNGTWHFGFDDADRGLIERWFDDPARLDRRIVVPFGYQTAPSGIGDARAHPVVWYARPFTLPDGWQGRRVRLHFGAVWWRSQVWVNGTLAATHEGGWTPFQADVTRCLVPGENWVAVRAGHHPEAGAAGSGPTGVRAPGIWQSVWLEPVPEAHVAELRVLPDPKRECVHIGVTLSCLLPGVRVRAEVSLTGAEVGSAEQAWLNAQNAGSGPVAWVEVPIRRPLLWCPEDPDLYTLTVEVEAPGQAADRVACPFGMRTVAVAGGRFLLNGRPYPLRVAREESPWPEGSGTAPTDRAIRERIEAARAGGFNAVHVRQGVADPRYHYWADRLGVLVWPELPTPPALTPDGLAALTAEWQQVVRRDWNHPSIAGWVPPEIPRAPASGSLRRSSCRHVFRHLARALDPTRPVCPPLTHLSG